MTTLNSKRPTTLALSWAAADLGLKDSRFIAIVAQCESARNPLFSDGKTMKRLTEPHLFGRYTRHTWHGRQVMGYPVSTRSWKDNRYPGKLEIILAIEKDLVGLDSEAFYDASSWAMFQTLGTNAEICGWGSATQMIQAYRRSATAQLIGFVNYCHARRLEEPMAAGDLDAFGLAYNGRYYKQNGYIEKLLRAQAEVNKNPDGWVVESSPDLRTIIDAIPMRGYSELTLNVQKALNDYGILPQLEVDGYLGPMTHIALIQAVLEQSRTVREVAIAVDELTRSLKVQ